MAQRKDSPNKPADSANPRSPRGSQRSAGSGGGKGASGGDGVEVAKNTSVHREKASPSGRGRGETSHADRS